MNRSDYEVLGIAPDADTEEIEAAYRKLAKKYHPDTGGNAEEFKKITAAYISFFGSARAGETKSG